jgi:hypothetical protein
VLPKYVGLAFSTKMEERWQPILFAIFEIFFLVCDAICIPLGIAGVIISPFRAKALWIFLDHEVEWESRGSTFAPYTAKLRYFLLLNFFAAVVDLGPMVCFVVGMFTPTRAYPCLWGTRHIFGDSIFFNSFTSHAERFQARMNEARYWWTFCAGMAFCDLLCTPLFVVGMATPWNFLPLLSRLRKEYRAPTEETKINGRTYKIVNNSHVFYIVGMTGLYSIQDLFLVPPLIFALLSGTRTLPLLGDLGIQICTKTSVTTGTESAIESTTNSTAESTIEAAIESTTVTGTRSAIGSTVESTIEAAIESTTMSTSVVNVHWIDKHTGYNYSHRLSILRNAGMAAVDILFVPLVLILFVTRYRYPTGDLSTSGGARWGLAQYGTILRQGLLLFLDLLTLPLVVVVIVTYFRAAPLRVARAKLPSHHACTSHAHKAAVVQATLLLLDALCVPFLLVVLLSGYRWRHVRGATAKPRFHTNPLQFHAALLLNFGVVVFDIAVLVPIAAMLAASLYKIPALFQLLKAATQSDPTAPLATVEGRGGSVPSAERPAESTGAAAALDLEQNTLPPAEPLELEPYDPVKSAAAGFSTRCGVLLLFVELVADIPFLLMAAVLGITLWRVGATRKKMGLGIAVKTSWHWRNVVATQLALLVGDVLVFPLFMILMGTFYRFPSVVFQLMSRWSAALDTPPLFETESLFMEAAAFGEIKLYFSLVARSAAAATAQEASPVSVSNVSIRAEVFLPTSSSSLRFVHSCSFHSGFRPSFSSSPPPPPPPASLTHPLLVLLLQHPLLPPQFPSLLSVHFVVLHRARCFGETWQTRWEAASRMWGRWDQPPPPFSATDTTTTLSLKMPPTKNSFNARTHTCNVCMCICIHRLYYAAHN